MRWFRSRRNELPPADLGLLADLLAAAPPPRGRFARAELRSIDEQQQLALRPFRRRTGFDRFLGYLELALSLAAVVTFGIWFADGYGRDLWRSWRGEAHAQSAAAAPSAPPSGASVEAAIPLPFVDPQRTDEPVEAVAAAPAPVQADFLAPQLLAEPLAAPVDRRPSRLRSAAIGLDTAVVEVFVADGAWQVAEYAAGFHHGTALPDEAGNTVLAGHAGLHGAVFRRLPDLPIGAMIELDAGGWRYEYRVREHRRVWPTEVGVMAPSSTAILTLITCTDWDTRRLVVIADLVASRPLE